MMVGGYGAGSAIFGPVATSLIATLGWRLTFQVLGVVFFVMGMFGAALLKNPPAGYRPAGWRASDPVTSTTLSHHRIPEGIRE